MAVDPQSGLTLADYTCLPPSMHTAFQDTVERDDGIALLFFLSAVDRITSKGSAPRVIMMSRLALYLCTLRPRSIAASNSTLWRRYTPGGSTSA